MNVVFHSSVNSTLPLNNICFTLECCKTFFLWFAPLQYIIFEIPVYYSSSMVFASETLQRLCKRITIYYIESAICLYQTHMQVKIESKQYKTEFLTKFKIIENQYSPKRMDYFYPHYIFDVGVVCTTFFDFGKIFHLKMFLEGFCACMNSKFAENEYINYISWRRRNVWKHLRL